MDQQLPYALYNSNEVSSDYSDTRLLLMVGSNESSDLSSFDQIPTDKWIASLIPFEYNHHVFNLKPKGTNQALCFEPTTVLEYTPDNQWVVHKAEHKEWVQQFKNIELCPLTLMSCIRWQDIDQNKYRADFEHIYAHIKRGNVYEVNYCTPFEGEYDDIEPVEMYAQINTQTQAPFSCIFRMKDTLVLSFSPERFYLNKAQRLISQPIKGTAKTDLANPEHNQEIIQNLLHSTKERAENTMIVDLVRHDMSQLAREVTVTRFLEVQSFPTVHQLVSTIEAQLPQQNSMSQVFAHLFPMGSMTGAPKQSMLSIVHALEQNRGYYSGSIGYQRPDGTQNFNVVIRSLVFDLDLQLVNLWVGSAITFLANADDELKECYLKAKVILEATKCQL